MIAKVCPDCWLPLSEEKGHCQSCGWKVAYRKGIKEFLSSADRASSEFDAYLTNYDCIAGDDLSKSIQDPYYLKLQFGNFRRYVGSVRDLHVCDVGVGQGLLIKSFENDQPASITAVDVAVDYLERIRELPNVEAVVANAERLPFRGTFDLLTASDVLEHVLNPGDFLASANRSIRTGGSFVVKVPYRENLMQYSRLLGCPYSYVHLRSFDRATLVDLLNFAGFEIDKVYYDGFLPMRVRNYIKNSKWLSEKFNEWSKSLGSPFKAGEINPYVARLVMRPLEITVVAKKKFEI